ncbi:beta-N-acetylhexosaminidase [Rhodopila sp.]|uniref:beta-N-acetylhexosaminidase n=1 Tax=Rhodopila sp. TaxID=2480087 RepID=UPI002C3002EC|nr:beta-N-acetylhexosaminidase [Rhodopila sp.]HVZ06547.1 beta-N-acetylhexosaminidase [Rhodopila sp.]
MKAAIVGIAGLALEPEEAALFRAQPPAGVILFRRNVHDPGQLRRLTAALRDVLPPHAEIMVDQEGGRVARLRPPHWQAHPAAGVIGALTPDRAARAAWLTGALIGLQCADAGFTIAAAPVLDIAIPGAHDVVGDRSFGADPDHVARLGRAMADGLMAAGILPVGKHCPGHGRASVDSHLALPRVTDDDLSADILPFALNADLPWMMTAHIVYDGLDPARPATLSPAVIETVIRGRIGFEGALVTDDLAMKALSGAPADKAVAALAAGCDLALYCDGDLPSNIAVLRAVPVVTPAAERRLARGRALLAARRREWEAGLLDAGVLSAERASLLPAVPQATSRA